MEYKNTNESRGPEVDELMPRELAKAVEVELLPTRANIVAHSLFPNHVNGNHRPEHIERILKDFPQKVWSAGAGVDNLQIYIETTYAWMRGDDLPNEDMLEALMERLRGIVHPEEVDGVILSPEHTADYVPIATTAEELQYDNQFDDIYGEGPVLVDLSEIIALRESDESAEPEPLFTKFDVVHLEPGEFKLPRELKVGQIAVHNNGIIDFNRPETWSYMTRQGTIYPVGEEVLGKDF